jgi:hypothetical protein
MATFSGDVQYSQNGTVTNPWQLSLPSEQLSTSTWDDRLAQANGRPIDKPYESRYGEPSLVIYIYGKLYGIIYKPSRYGKLYGKPNHQAS